MYFVDMGCYMLFIIFFILFLLFVIVKGFWFVLVFVCKEWSGLEIFVFGRWVIICFNLVLGIYVFDIIWIREFFLGYFLKFFWCLFID